MQRFTLERPANTQDPELRPARPMRVDVAEVLSAAVDDVRSEHPEALIDASAGALPAVRADPDLLRQAFASLLRGAVTRAGARVTVALHGRARADGVVLWWTDASARDLADEPPSLPLRFAAAFVDRLGGRVERARCDIAAGYVFRLPEAAAR